MHNLLDINSDDLSEEWAQLQELLSEVNLEEGRDRVGWAFVQSKKFTTSSLCKLITSGGIRDQQIMNI
jgi:hypothetical protein